MYTQSNSQMKIIESIPRFVQVHDLSFRLLLSPEQIQTKVNELGKALTADFKGKNPLLIGILNGAFIFAADLMRACAMDCEISFVRLSSYKGTASTGEIATLIGLKRAIQGRHVIIVEDIVDTGTTLHHFLPDLKELQPASLSLLTLLLKPDALKYPIPIDYVGFEIPKLFVVGYGLDYEELGRNLKGIYQLYQ